MEFPVGTVLACSVWNSQSTHFRSASSELRELVNRHAKNWLHKIIKISGKVQLPMPKNVPKVPQDHARRRRSTFTPSTKIERIPGNEETGRKDTRKFALQVHRKQTKVMNAGRNFDEISTKVRRQFSAYGRFSGRKLELELSESLFWYNHNHPFTPIYCLFQKLRSVQVNTCVLMLLRK